MTDASCDADAYEDLLSILDELSFRELRALSILDGYSSTIERAPGDNDYTLAQKFWDALEKTLTRELSIPADQLDDFMNRLSRTGCFETFEGKYTAAYGGMGRLTPTYYSLKQFVSQPGRA
ncbi:hypothetical protein [Luteolibacter soli]|uniref:Uncharacterized protein n=1 Tax=Luteolibacter soli TaxID=3135280 RepID=A0ABU9B2G4_9BACT